MNPAEVAGTIEKITDVSVLCSFMIGGIEYNAQIPRALFPSTLYYAMPIYLTVVQEDGVCTPVIRVREIDALTTENEEMEALIQRLPSGMVP